MTYSAIFRVPTNKSLKFEYFTKKNCVNGFSIVLNA